MVAVVLLLGVFAYQQSVRATLFELKNHLESVAALQARRTQDTLQQNLDLLALIRGDMALKRALLAHLDSGEEAALDRARQILIGVASELAAVREISVVAATGRVLVTTNPALAGRLVVDAAKFGAEFRTDRAESLFLAEDGRRRLLVTGPIYMEGRQLGAMLIETDAEVLQVMVSEYAGLGRSGESLLVRREKNGDALFLTPLRFRDNAALHHRIPAGTNSSAAIQALDGHYGFLPDAVDYRGVRVFAVTRLLTGTDWGLVVKIDREEVLGELAILKVVIVASGLLALLFAVLLAFSLSRRLVDPLKLLTARARALTPGDDGAEPVTGDELTALADAFKRLEEARAAEASEMEGSLAEQAGRTNRLQEELVEAQRQLQVEAEQRERFERKLEISDRRWKLALEGSLSGIWEWTHENPEILWLSESCYTMLGYENQAFSPRVEGVNEILYSEDRSRAQAVISSALRRGLRRSAEVRLRCQDGVYRWFELRAALEWDGDEDQPLRAVGSMEDITARKQTEEVNLQLMAELERRATQDALTGLFNRGYFNERMTEEIKRSSRTGAPFSLIILDGDHFKNVNDTYGHVTGDMVLKELSRCIEENDRETDVPCRFGGEEFTVCLPDTDEQGALVIGERIRTAIEAMELRSEDGREFSITASIGIAQWRKGEDMDALVMRADEAVYHSKNTGRNRVTLASELAAQEQASSQ